jgi:hypothetical protein
LFVDICDTALQGKLPPELGGLGRLKDLNLGANDFRGEIFDLNGKCITNSTF